MSVATIGVCAVTANAVEAKNNPMANFRKATPYIIHELRRPVAPSRGGKANTKTIE
jgi:hypothetical protein